MNFLPFFWRELKINSTNLSRLVNHFLNPMVVLILFATMFTIYVREISYAHLTIKFIDFFIPGLLTLQAFMLFSMTFSMVRIDNVRGFLSEIAISKTRLSAYYLGSLLANMSTTILRIVILAIGAHFLVGTALPANPINIIIILLAISIGCIVWYSIGFLCGIFIHREEIRDFVFSLLIFPLTFASTLYYRIEDIPSSLRQIVLFNPLTHNVNAVREAFLLETPTSWFSDLSILTPLALFLVVASFISVRRAVR